MSFSWSYSKYALFEQCPAAYNYKHNLKLPDPPSPAMERGNKIHKRGEDFLVKRGLPLPKEYAPFSAEMFHLRDAGAKAEEKVGFFRDWSPTTFFHKGVWLRSIYDATLVTGTHADVVDFKTGKKYETNLDQIELFSATVFVRNEDIQTVTARLWYLDSGDEVAVNFSRPGIEAALSKWTARAGKIEHEQNWPARPNSTCRWCNFSKSKGGPCRFS